MARLTADVDVTARVPATLSNRDLVDALTRQGFRFRFNDPTLAEQSRILPFVHGGTGLRGPRPGREFPPPSQLIDLKSRNPDGRGRSQVKDTTMSDQNEREPLDVSRRTFLEGTSAALVIAATAPAVAAQTPAAQPAPVATTTISVTVNGTVHRVDVEDRWTLADLLRDQLRLTGTKLGCERGECGACTVILDGKPVYACSQLAVWTDGRLVMTVEGLARNGQLHPLQQAFIEHDAPQCGFCTSGQLMSAKALLDRNPHPTPQDVRTALVGNICRCSNYNRYVEAIVAVGAGRTAPVDPRQTGGAA